VVPEDEGAIEAEDGVRVCELEFRELCEDPMVVVAFERVEFVGFAFEEMDVFREEAELGGS